MLDFIRFSKKIYRRFLSHNRCLICRNATGVPFYLCRTCLSLLPTLPNFCKKCFSLKHFNPHTKCQSCFERVYALYGYEEYIKLWLIKLKFHKQLFFAHLLGTLLGHALKRHLSPPFPEVILPVPLHLKRLKEREFNQSYQIAKRVEKALSIPIDNEIIVKIKHTVPQSTLNLPARYRNLTNAFEVKQNHYRHVAIIDDVYTTGTTAKTIAKQLHKSGVKKVEIWCVARSLHTS